MVQGSDPLDGVAAATGLVGSASTPDTALDVCALNDIAAVAHQTGVSVFNVFNAMGPVIVAQVPMPGAATRVACAADLLAVATGGDGLAVVDLEDPPAATLVHQVPVGGSAVSVATGGLRRLGGHLGRLGGGCRHALGHRPRPERQRRDHRRPGRGRRSALRARTRRPARAPRPLPQPRSRSAARRSPPSARRASWVDAVSSSEAGSPMCRRSGATRSTT